MLRGEAATPARSITACRDPKDNKDLELAVAGPAEVLVTGDEDLLVLHPFEGIPVVTSADLLRRLDEEIL